MTIAKSVWKALVFLFPDCVERRVKGLKSVVFKSGVQLVCNDVMTEIRRIPSSPYPRFPGDHGYTRNCREFAEKVFFDALRTLCVSSKALSVQDTEDLVGFEQMKASDVDYRLTVDTYVVCFDPFGMRRPEKAHTTKKRQEQSIKRVEKGAPTVIRIPSGQRSFFEDDKPLPYDVNTIFSDATLKRELYLYLTEYVQRESFKARIPSGKTFILSGGLEKVPTSPSSSNDRTTYRNCEPLLVSGGQVRKMKDMHDSRGQISEGDLDAWRWVHRFPKKNFIVKSGDADLFLIGLMQMRDVMSINPNRVGWFCTRRSLGTRDRSTEETLYKQEKSSLYQEALEKGLSKQKAFELSKGVTSFSSKRKQIIWSTQYVNMFELWCSIIIDSESRYCIRGNDNDESIDDFVDESDTRASSSLSSSSSSSPSSSSSSSSSTSYNYQDVFKLDEDLSAVKSTFTLAPQDDGITPKVPPLDLDTEHMWKRVRFPVEQFVLVMLILTNNHDYIKTSSFAPRVNSAHCLLAYFLHFHKIGGMIEVKQSSLNARKKYYTVNTLALRRWAVCSYHVSVKKRIKRNGKRSNKQLFAARKRSLDNTLSKNLPSLDRHQMLAAHCLWVLQYYGNGCHLDVGVQSGIHTPQPTSSMFKEEQKRGVESVQSFYGYTKQGYSEQVKAGNLRSSYQSGMILDTPS